MSMIAFGRCRALQTSLLLLFFSIHSYSVTYAQPTMPNAPTSGWVLDWSGTVTDADQANLNAAMSSLSVDNGTEMFMFAAPDCGVEPSSYAQQIFTNWQVGVQQQGLLLVMCVNQGRVFIEVSEQLQGIISKEVEERGVSNYLKPKLANGDLTGGVIGMINYFASLIGPVNTSTATGPQTSLGPTTLGAQATQIATQANATESGAESAASTATEDSQRVPAFTDEKESKLIPLLFRGLQYTFIAFVFLLIGWFFYRRNQLKKNGEYSESIDDTREVEPDLANNASFLPGQTYPGLTGDRFDTHEQMTQPMPVLDLPAQVNHTRDIRRSPEDLPIRQSPFVPDDIIPAPRQRSDSLEDRGPQTLSHGDLTPPSDEVDSELSDVGDHRPGTSDTGRKKGDNPFDPFE